MLKLNSEIDSFLDTLKSGQSRQRVIHRRHNTTFMTNYDLSYNVPQ